MTKLDRQMQWIGYISASTGGALLGQTLIETGDWRIAVACLLCGLGGLIIGDSK